VVDGGGGARAESQVLETYEDEGLGCSLRLYDVNFFFGAPFNQLGLERMGAGYLR
jgi:hypothetical protein